MNSFAQNTVFDIKGTRIPYHDILNYQIVRKEYIYRPVFQEKKNSLAKMVSIKKFDFLVMTPYAAVITKEEFEALTASGAKANSQPTGAGVIIPVAAAAATLVTGGSFLADLAVGAVGAVVEGTVGTVKASLEKQKIFCVNQAGRAFATSLKAIPPVLVFSNGQIVDANKNIASKITIPGEQTATIKQIDALVITTKTSQYGFYGSGIDIPNAQTEYYRLKNELDAYSMTILNEVKPTQRSSFSDKLRNLFG